MKKQYNGFAVVRDRIPWEALKCVACFLILLLLVLYFMMVLVAVLTYMEEHNQDILFSIYKTTCFVAHTDICDDGSPSPTTSPLPDLKNDPPSHFS